MTEPVDNASRERQRISAILGAEQAKGRETLAQHIAFNTALSVEQALAALAASAVAPVAAPARPRERLLARYAAELNPQVPSLDTADIPAPPADGSAPWPVIIDRVLKERSR